MILKSDSEILSGLEKFINGSLKGISKDYDAEPVSVYVTYVKFYNRLDRRSENYYVNTALKHKNYNYLWRFLKRYGISRPRVTGNNPYEGGVQDSLPEGTN